MHGFILLVHFYLGKELKGKIWVQESISSICAHKYIDWLRLIFAA